MDCPLEYWHADCWGSSIRTCSGDWIRYLDQSPVFPSDILQYRCMTPSCTTSHLSLCGQVTFFGHDRRHVSPTKNQELLRICLLIVLGASQDPRLENCLLADDEMLMIEDGDRQTPSTWSIGSNSRMER